MGRKVVTRAPHREVGIVNPRWLLDHGVEHESHLEKRFIMVALSCPVVVDIVHQPLQLTLGYEDGTTEKYTPDFKVTFRDQSSTIVEVKPRVFVEKHRRKLDQAKKQLEAEGQAFDVITDTEIDANGLSARALLLMRYARMQFSDQDAAEWMRLLNEECSGSAEVRALVEKGANEALIWNMVARHQFRIPIGINVTAQETVSINTIEGDLHVYFLQWFGIEAR